MDSDSNTKLIVLLSISIILVILSTIFSATESAFLSINKLRVRLLQNKKDRRAMRVWKLLQHKDRLINTLLVGNNIVNIALSSIITIITIDLFGNAGVGIATFITTLLLLIFGEITPKTIATHHPEPIAFFFSGFIYAVNFVLTPITFILTKFSRSILQILHVDTKSKSVTFTEEEIKTFLDVGKEQGVIEKNETKMMRRVFKFSDLEAKDIMIPRKRIKAISEQESFSSIIELSERFRLSRFPVYKTDIDDITGILYIKDMMAYKNCPKDFSVTKVMRPPLFILETKKMSSIQVMLRENHQSMAVVIDEYSGTFGILTVEDIVREIFGPITDEYKPYARKVDVQIKNSKNTEVDGLSRLIEINDQLGINLTSEMNETLGGWLCEQLGEIPHIGQNVKFGGYKWTITKMDENRVSRVKIQETE